MLAVVKTLATEVSVERRNVTVGVSDLEKENPMLIEAIIAAGGRASILAEWKYPLRSTFASVRLYH